jgi:hypothetical protein
MVHPVVYGLQYALALWLGLYLWGRNSGRSALRWAAVALLIYAAAVAVDFLMPYLPETVSQPSPWAWPLRFLTLLPVAGALPALLPEESIWRLRWARPWRVAWLPALAGLYLSGVLASNGLAWADVIFTTAVVVLLALLVGQAWLLLAPASTRPLVLLWVAVLLLLSAYFGLLLNSSPASTGVLNVALGAGLILLGTAAAWLDALEEGQAFLPDILRAFDYTFFAIFIFAGPVALIMVIDTGRTPTMLFLLLTTISSAVVFQLFADTIQQRIDAFAFATWPWLQQARAELRTAASALPHLDPAHDLAAISDAEFARLTRRALSQLGDLPRLAANPLTRLPAVTARLAATDTPDNVLARAMALRTVLSESIDHLKPADGSAFATTDVWRHYNALYFPYVVGLKPYGRRISHNGLDPVAREALRWLQNEVPERTLYNWQTAAARLVAQELRQNLQDWQ